MLVHKQIRTLAKPYSDRAMIGKSDRCALGTKSDPMWSNLSIVFFGESEPKSTPKNFEPSALQPNNMEDIQDWCVNPGVQVWPVEIGPLYSDDGYSKSCRSMVLLRFMDKAGNSHWADARYVSAVLKRHSDPDWYYNENRLMAKDSTPVTIASNGTEVTIPKGDPIAILMEWRWSQADTTDNYRNWNPDWRLCNEDIQSWYTLRWAQRLDQMLPKGRRGNKLTCLNGGSLPACRVKLGKHKYIKIAGENRQGSAMISLYNGEVANHILKGD